MLPLLATLLLAPALDLRAPAFDRLAWTPAPGSVLERSFESELALAVESVEVLFNGVDRTPEEQLEALPRTTRSQRIVVRDGLDGVGPFWPTRMTRRFLEAERATTTALGEAQPQPEEPRRSPLVDQEVVFLWLDEEGAHRKLYVGERGEAALLEGLEEDLDLRGLLPRGSIEVDERWRVDPRALGPWLRPGGDLALAADAESGRIEEMLRRTLVGELWATYAGVREEDGRRLGVVRLEGELQSGGALDLGRAAMATSDKSLEERWTLDLGGEVTWDLEHGHLSAGRIDARVEVERLERYELVESGGEGEPEREIVILHRTRSAGELQLSASVRRR